MEHTEGRSRRGAAGSGAASAAVHPTHLCRFGNRQRRSHPEDQRTRGNRFIAGFVAAGLPCAHTDAVDEWLRVALALSIEIFSERPPRPRGHSRKASCLNGSIRGSRDVSGRRTRPAHRWLDGDHSPYPRRLRRRTEDREGSISPDDAVDEAVRRR